MMMKGSYLKQTMGSFVALLLLAYGLVWLDAWKRATLVRCNREDLRSINGSIGRAQQVFYLEEQSFAESLDELDLGISDDVQFDHKSDNLVVHRVTIPDRPARWIGATALVSLSTPELPWTTTTINCLIIDKDHFLPPIIQDNQLQCGDGTLNVEAATPPLGYRIKDTILHMLMPSSPSCRSPWYYRVYP
jgi:hypothetical protein